MKVKLPSADVKSTDFLVGSPSVYMIEINNSLQSPQAKQQSWFSKYWYFLFALATALVLAYVFLSGGFDERSSVEQSITVFGFTNDEEANNFFDFFIKRFSKDYATEEEREKRFAAFKANYAHMREERTKQTGVQFEINVFMDYTDEELAQRLNGDKFVPFEGLSPFEHFDEKVDRPIDHSWKSKMARVKDQGQCGSCWAFATVATVEAANAIAGNPLISLSEQEMIDCDSKNMGCRGGVRQYAMAFVADKGLVPDTGYPYTAQEGEECKLKANETRVKIKSYKWLSSNEETIADWVFKTGPVTFGMNVTKSMYSYRSGIFEPTVEDCTEHSLGSHALTIVGFGKESGKDYWLVKNSWGSWWGDSGYFKLIRGTNNCGMANNVVAPIF